MDRKARLGRGLDALFGSGDNVAPNGKQSQVALEVIEENPYQPRKAFDDDDLASLRDSIRTHGVLQPLVVRAIGDHYQLIAGERRLRAAKAAGLTAVPVTVVDFNDQQVLEAALVENIQRTDLNPIEKAHGLKDYLTPYQMTHEQLAGRLGLGRATITNLVALLELPTEVQDAVRVGQLTSGHAKALKGITDPARQTAVAREIMTQGLSVHATEAYVKRMAAAPQEEGNGDQSGSQESSASSRSAGAGSHKTAHVQSIEDELRQKLSLKIEIRVKGKDKGQVVLSFESNDDFDRVVEVLRR